MLAQLFQDTSSLRWADTLLTSVLWWCAVLWFAALGGCVGSFLNVVWDRRATGTNIIFPPSRCSECGHAIRWYHNLPILGWLILRGRCYDCGASISPKHVLVEAFFAALFVSIALLTPWL